MFVKFSPRFLFAPDDGVGGGGDPAAPPADSAVETPPAGVEGAAIEETDPFDDEGVETFSRSYVKSLREKADRYRTERNDLRSKIEPVQGLLERAHADDLPHIAAALQDLYSPDEAARAQAGRWLAQVGAKSAGAKRDIAVLFDDVQDAVEEAEEELDRDLTADEVQRLVNEALEARDNKAAQEAERAAAAQRLKDVEDTLAEKGYGRGEDGKPNLEALQILARSESLDTVEGEDHIGRLTRAIEAHEAAKADERKQIEEEAVKAFIEGRRKDADGSPRVPNDGVAAADAKKRPSEMTKEELIAYKRALTATPTTS